jgi:hypothetical protein
MPEKRSAIPPDELLERPIEELSAPDLLFALNHPALDQAAVRLLPDKKKYELWVDEGGVTKLTVRDLVDRLGNEKKKVELEVPMKRTPAEIDPDPRKFLIDPLVLEVIATRVAERLQGR